MTETKNTVSLYNNRLLIALFTQQENIQITSHIVIIAQDPKQHLLRTKIKKKNRIRDTHYLYKIKIDNQ